MKISDWKYKIILLLFLISLASSLIISLAPLPMICSPSEGCYIVQNSIYAKTLGINNDYFGDIIFLTMSIIIISYILKPTKAKKLLINLGVYLGALIAVYFLYLQQFVIHAFCKYCLMVDFSMILAFILTFIPDKTSNRKTEETVKDKIDSQIKLSLED